MAASGSTREKNLLLARLAEKENRYEDMVGFMVLAVDQTDQLNGEDRRLLNHSFKHVINADRVALRTIRKADNNPIWLEIQSHRDSYCNRFIKLLDSKFIPSVVGDPQETVYYHLIKADMQRYLAESKTGRDLVGPRSNGQDSYFEAQKLARRLLTPNHKITLLVALNYAVFTNGIARSPEAAVLILKKAYDAAVQNASNRLDNSEFLNIMTGMIKELEDVIKARRREEGRERARVLSSLYGPLYGVPR